MRQQPNFVCPDCGKPVLRAITAAGHKQLLNLEPDERGNTALYRDGVGTWRARVPTPDFRLQPHERIHMPHKATCTGNPASAGPALRSTNSGQLPAGVVSLASHRRKRKT